MSKPDQVETWLDQWMRGKDQVQTDRAREIMEEW
jgi:hypothetical protein